MGDKDKFFDACEYQAIRSLVKEVQGRCGRSF